jgi:hypothetical protein
MNLGDRLTKVAADPNNKSRATFSGNFPTPFDESGILEVGDVLNFPDNYTGKIFQHNFHTTDRDGKPVLRDFVVIEVTNETKEPRAIEFYPTSLFKNVWKASIDETSKMVTTDLEAGPVHPSGTLVELAETFRTQQDGMNKFMDNIKGKKVKISAKDVYPTQRWRKGQPVNEIRKSSVCRYDIIG